MHMTFIAAFLFIASFRASALAAPSSPTTAGDPAGILPAAPSQETHATGPAPQNNADILTLPSLKADRKLQRVELEAFGTGLKTNEIVEFLLISEASGHGYEALLTSKCKPSDLHRALEFIGLKPGAPTDPKALRFWPKGERVRVSVIPKTPADPQAKPVRIEKMVLNPKTGETMPEVGLVFTGSKWTPSNENPAVKVYAADVTEPNSIASTYNESTTVLDVPRIAPQSDFYGTLVTSQLGVFPTGTPLRVFLEPDAKDGRSRVVDLTLGIFSKTNAPGNSLADQRFCLEAPDGKHEETLDAILRRMRSLADNGQDPFVTLRVEPQVPLRALRELATLLISIEGEHGIRIEPPLAGDLYFKAFCPNEKFRDRKDRVVQPWELHISLKDGQARAVLLQLTQQWKDGGMEPDLQIQEHPLQKPEDLPALLEKLGSGLPVILVFAPGSITYSSLMAFLRPVQATHDTIHVFQEQPPTMPLPIPEKK